jgi:F-type H+-transporting ATPase subunit delta
VLPHVHVDPAILGGIIVRYGDNVIDGSLRRRLIGLRQRLITASVAVR